MKKSVLFVIVAVTVIASSCQRKYNFSNDELKAIFESAPMQSFPPNYAIADFNGHEKMAIKNRPGSHRHLMLHRQPNWVSPKENIEHAAVPIEPLIYTGSDSTYHSLSFYYQNKLFLREEVRIGIEIIKRDSNLYLGDCCDHLTLSGAKNDKYSLFCISRQYDFANTYSSLFLNGDIVFKAYYIPGISSFCINGIRVWRNKFIVSLSDPGSANFFAIFDPEKKEMIFPSDMEKVKKHWQDYYNY